MVHTGGSIYLCTTEALAVCRELGFQAIEVNASDTRNKADASAVKGIAGKLSNSLHVLSTNTSLGGPGSKVIQPQFPENTAHKFWRQCCGASLLVSRGRSVCTCSSCMNESDWWMGWKDGRVRACAALLMHFCILGSASW